MATVKTDRQAARIALATAERPLAAPKRRPLNPAGGVAVVYDRGSSAQQEFNFSRGDAERLIIVAEQKGYRAEFRREIRSGETITDRPTMRQLLDDVSAGRVQAIVCQDFTRLSRDRDGIDGRIIRQICRDAGCLVITPEKTYDFDLDVDDDLADMGFFIGKIQKRQNLKAMMRGRVERARRGLFNGGHVSLGYENALTGRFRADGSPEREFRISQAQLPVFRRDGTRTDETISERVLARLILAELYPQHGAAGTAQRLNSQGYHKPSKARGNVARLARNRIVTRMRALVRAGRLTAATLEDSHVLERLKVVSALPSVQERFGATFRPFSASDVMEMVKNPLYAGMLVWGVSGKTLRDGEPTHTYRQDLQIISVQQYRANLATVQERRQLPGRSVHSDYPLTHLLRCPHCRGPLAGSSTAGNHGMRHVYRCSLRIRAGVTACRGFFIAETLALAAVIPFAVEWLERRIDLGRYLAAAIDEAQHTSTEAEIEQAVHSELEATEAAMQRLVDAVADGVLSGEQARSKNLQLLEKRERLESELATLAKKHAEREELQDLLDAAASLANGVEPLIRSMAKEQPRQFNRLLRLLFRALVIAAEGRTRGRRAWVGEFESSPALEALTREASKGEGSVLLKQTNGFEVIRLREHVDHAS